MIFCVSASPAVVSPRHPNRIVSAEWRPSLRRTDGRSGRVTRGRGLSEASCVCGPIGKRLSHFFRHPWLFRGALEESKEADVPCNQEVNGIFIANVITGSSRN